MKSNHGPGAVEFTGVAAVRTRAGELANGMVGTDVGDGENEANEIPLSGHGSTSGTVRRNSSEGVGSGAMGAGVYSVLPLAAAVAELADDVAMSAMMLYATRSKAGTTTVMAKHGRLTWRSILLLGGGIDDGEERSR